MSRFRFLTCTLLLLASCPASGDDVVDRADCRILYRCLDPDTLTLRYRMEVTETETNREEGGPYLVVSQKWYWPDGRISEYFNRLSREAQTERAVLSSRKEYDADGTVFLEETVDFTVRPAEFPPNTYPYTAIFAVHSRNMRRLQEKRKFQFYSVFPGTALARIRSRLSGSERVEVAGLSVQCFKVVMDPDLSYFMGSIGSVVNLFVQFFMPGSTMWFLEAPPHTLIRYQGLSSGESRIRPVLYEMERQSLEGLLAAPQPEAAD